MDLGQVRLLLLRFGDTDKEVVLNYMVHRLEVGLMVGILG